jgi:hypothetical protein
METAMTKAAARYQKKKLTISKSYKLDAEIVKMSA